MKCSQLKLGRGAVKVVEMTMLGGAAARIGLRVLVGADEAIIMQRAAEFAAARGAADPRDGHPLYELGKAVHLIVTAAVDPDEQATAFFDGGADQVCANLDVERIFLLKEKQLIHQAEAAPGPGKMTGDEFIASVLVAAKAEEGAELPFESWPLVMRRSWARTLAVLYVTSLSLSSPTTSPSEESTPSSSAAQDEKPEPSEQTTPSEAP